ncbi:TlpA family protein disulfide reductase [Sporosarcina sp. ACRSL]|uniref:TlpA family protein disulfide reductase n=1 Tax=Sporosarcina sp. ACRSL TaxID=2918215 RepID=UPI001EF6B34C|nr:TlpA disulfide reductase family protein [Sporosarcina sp. ACRSL]MCG7342719.1 TlpA family protein disulfide reductase [Sporosarcina sp. ACRSL]
MKLGDQMPELIGETTWLNGYRERVDLIGEKPTLIHFWSVSCRLCKDVMPYVNHFRDHYKGKLNVIAVHMPRSKDDVNLEKIKSAAYRYNITEPIFVDNDLQLSDDFNNQYVPAYYVFDKHGRLRHFQAGGSGMKMLKTRVNRLMQEMNNY